MNIYDSNGGLDLDAARAAGNALPRANVDPKMQAQQIVIAALLDIAESLRPLAAEAVAAAAENAIRYDSEDDFGVTRVDPDAILGVGDVVALRGDATHGVFGEIIEVTTSEGEFVATVDTYDGGQQRVWLKELDRLSGDEGEEPDPRAEVIIDKPAEVTLMDGTEPPKDEEGYPILSAAPDLTDELDEDFDGDAHTAAEDAVAKLAEAEAKRKAEKKKAKK